MSRSVHPTDLELLELRAEGAGDGLAELRGIRMLRSAAAEAFCIGSKVPPDIATTLEAAWSCAAAASDPAAAPPALDACERLLIAERWNVERRAGIEYLIEPGVRFETDAAIERSDRPTPEWLRDANPGGWHPVEWNELLDGCLGPWAMATRGRRIVSICHTPVPLTDHMAECGVWTDPGFRGQGYAAATTAQWAELLRPSGRFLFYGTDVDNGSSRRVAQRLKLRRLGYQWLLREVGEQGESQVHPLSRLRGRGEAR